MKIQIIGGPTHSPAQLTARRAEDQRVDDTYPGQNVAYIDEWDGDVLRRSVVAAAFGPEAFQKLLGALAPEVRRKVQMTRVPRADVLEIRPVFLD